MPKVTLIFSGTKPTASPFNMGKLIFVTGSGGALYEVQADGTGLRWRANGVIDPSVSPNGQQVAFTRWDGAGLGALFSLNLADGTERVIMSDLRQPKSPTWSPDGQQIMLSFQQGGLRHPQIECRFFDADDGLRLPENIEFISVSIKENGVEICFKRREDLQWLLRVVKVTTGEFADMPSDLYAYNPNWDPRQPWRVVYDGIKGLMQFDVTRHKNWPLTADVRDRDPVFSPDGQMLALTYKQHDHWEVYTLNLTTQERHRLTEPPLLADRQYSSAAPAWSPDGQYIAFVTNRTTAEHWEIWQMKADGSDQHAFFRSSPITMTYWGMNERLLNWVR